MKVVKLKVRTTSVVSTYYFRQTGGTKCPLESRRRFTEVMLVVYESDGCVNEDCQRGVC